MKTCPNCGEVMDRRAQRWRVRVRLYQQGQPEPLADSDPDLRADEPGTVIINSLPAVADHVAKLTYGFHAVEITGLEPETLRRKLKSLRPTLSRRKGNATWRVPYTVDNRPFMARVDVLRTKQP